MELEYENTKYDLYQAIKKVDAYRISIQCGDIKKERKQLAKYIFDNFKHLSSIIFTYLDIDIIQYFIDNQWKELSKEKKMTLLGYKLEKE